MNNNTISTTSSMNLSEIASRIKELAGVVTMALGLALFGIWFANNMNSYLGNIASGRSDSPTMGSSGGSLSENIGAAVLR